MKRNVVCISRTAGAGGETVGRLVAERLGYAYVDEEIIVLASQKAGLDPTEVARTEERAPLLDRLLDALTVPSAMSMIEAAGAYYWVGSTAVPVPAAENLRALIREAIEEIAARGRVVIVAHAASYALGRRPEVLRVLVTASPETRVERLTLLKTDDATRAVRDSDHEREHYLRRFYDVREELPLHYDLVVNTDTLAVEQSVAAIVAAASAA
ncbi:MAG: cytidylate kinase-like family protein [Candidatus Binatia bacterium]